MTLITSPSTSTRSKMMIHWRISIEGPPLGLIHSRKESRASRIVGAVFLLPFVLVLGAGFAAGLYFLASMVGGEFSLGYAAAAVGFMSLTGNLGYRTTG